MEAQKIYKNNVSPLEEIALPDAEVGKLYIMSNGMRIKIVSPQIFEIDKSSELVDGEIVENLTPKQLQLFWKLMNNT